MRSYLNDFNAIVADQRARDTVQALTDLNQEMAGLEVGRIARFLGEDTGGDAVSRKRASRTDTALSALQTALLDPGYAALYDGAFSRLRDAENAADIALEKAGQALTDAEAALDTTLTRAATLDDGTRVFKDAQGQVWTEDGQKVDAALAATIEWKGHEPGYETLLIRQQAVADAHNDMADLRGYQVTLGEFRERLSDEDNPLPADDLEDIIERTANEMPGLARRELEAAEGMAAPTSGMSAAVLPTLGD